MSTQDLTTQMTRLEQALANIIGVKPTYMRPPYLATGGNVLNTMRTMGYRVITNDIDAEDWNGKSPQQSQQKFQQAGAGGNGHIPLMHETYQGTVETLTPWLINWAKSNNLKLVTVGECACGLLYRNESSDYKQPSALETPMAPTLMQRAMVNQTVRRPAMWYRTSSCRRLPKPYMDTIEAFLRQDWPFAIC